MINFYISLIKSRNRLISPALSFVPDFHFLQVAVYNRTCTFIIYIKVSVLCRNLSDAILITLSSLENIEPVRE